MPTVATSTSVSVTGTAISFAEETLPMIQWSAAAVALLSGVVGILVGLWHLKVIWRKEYPKK